MEPTGLAGKAARSALLRLLRYTGSFHARMMLRFDILFTFAFRPVESEHLICPSS